MKVILTADVYKHGVAGEVITVADGFARNWLLPQRLAKKASPGALKELDKLLAASAERKAALEERLNDLARQIDGVELVFGRKASPTGKLFGSVTTSEIATELNTVTGIDINRRRISQTALRDVGSHMVPVRLGSNESPQLKITIVREEQLAAFLKARAETPAVAAVPQDIPEWDEVPVDAAMLEGTSAAMPADDAAAAS
ncbi:MAG: 50S ribosomal protein L9 [Chloroflexota bacterium]|nr:50S ribosomal protein L9 [Chloroflexota bacterium]